MHLLFLIVIFCYYFTQSKYNPQNLKKFKQSFYSIKDAGSLSRSCSGPFGINNSTTISLGNCGNQLYYIPISLGSNQQTFNLQFDTGSNVLWIPLLGGNITSGFNSSQSTTYNITNQPYNITYADNSQVSGYLGYDLQYVANTNINITGQILFASTVSSGANSAQVLGLVGYGYSTIQNPFDYAFQNGQIQSSVFSLDLNFLPNSSYLYYNNGLPSAILQQTVWVPIQQGASYWQIQVIGVTVGQFDFTSIAVNVAVIDSGTSLFYVNQDLFDAITYQYFNNEFCQVDQGFNICFCNQTSTWPQFKFMFKGVEVYIPAFSYTQQIQDDNGTQLCMANFGVLSDVQQLLLGDIFFSNYVITFDKINSRIGFQGNTTPVQVLGQGYFLYVQYVMSGLMILLGVFGFISCINMNKFKRKKLALEELGKQLM